MMPEQNKINDPPHHLPYGSEEGLNLKDILYRGKDYVLLLWKNKWLLLILAFLGAGIFYYRATKKPVTYNATLTFSLNEGEGFGNASIGGLLGQFGLGGTVGGKISLDKIVALSRTMRIVNGALFEKVWIMGYEDYLANHLISLYEFDKKWAESNPVYQDFRFKSDSFPLFNLLENAALKQLYGFTVGGEKPGLLSCTYGNESAIFSLTSVTENEALSLELTQHIFNHLSRFYIEQSSDKQKLTFELVKAKADSIYKKWTSSEYSVSNIDGSQRALWDPADQTNKSIQSKQSTMYAFAYGEALKNLEMADYALKYSTPFIREIDRPFAPLDAMAPNKRRRLLIGLILGMGLAIAWTIGKKIVLDAINS